MKNFIFGVLATVLVSYLGCAMYEAGRFDVAMKMGRWSE